MSRLGGKRINQIINPSQYKVGAYIRTGKKIEGVDVKKFQKDRVEEFCDEMNLQIVEWYIDDGVDAFDKDRKAYNKLIEDIKNNKINMIVTANLTRLAVNRYEVNKLFKFQEEYKFRTIFTDSRDELLKDRGSIHLEDYIEPELTLEELEYQE